MDSAKEMVEHNSWFTPYIFGQPQFEKLRGFLVGQPFTYCVLKKDAINDLQRLAEKVIKPFCLK